LAETGECDGEVEATSSHPGLLVSIGATFESTACRVSDTIFRFIGVDRSSNSCEERQDAQ